MHDIKLEKYILGTVLVFPERMSQSLSDIKPEMFYNKENSEIFKTFISLNNKKIMPDLMTVFTYLANDNKLDAVGGAYYINQLTAGIGTDVHFDEKKAIFIDLYIRRNLFTMYQEQLAFLSDLHNDYYESYEYIKRFVENMQPTDRDSSIVNKIIEYEKPNACDRMPVFINRLFPCI